MNPTVKEVEDLLNAMWTGYCVQPEVIYMTAGQYRRLVYGVRGYTPRPLMRRRGARGRKFALSWSWL